MTIDLHMFRGGQIGMPLNMQFCAAPIEAVAATFGGGGIYGEQGLLAAFGGAALFRDCSGTDRLLGVWGARKCSRFRRLLREAGYAIAITDLPPEMRLTIRWG